MKLILKSLWPLLKPFKAMMFWLIFIGFLISAMRGLSPELSKQLIEHWRLKDSTYNVIIPLGICLIWFLSSILRLYHAYKIRVISEKVVAKLRSDLMAKYLDFDLKFMQGLEHGSGGLISRITNEILYIQFGIQKMTDLLKEPFSAILMFGYLIYIDWKLTFFILITIPLVGTVLNSLSRSIRKYSNRSFNDLERISKTLKESLDGARIIKSFNLQQELEARFKSQTDTYIENRKKVIAREESAGPVIESLGSLGFAALLVYIGGEIVSDRLGVGDFMGFSFAIAMMQDSVKRVQQSVVALQQTIVSLDRFNEMMGSENQVKNPEVATDFPKDWKNIEFKNISFSYEDGKSVLKNFSLDVKRGQSIALVGSSGSGKSTVANLIQRFFDPQEGEILIDGINIRNFHLNELRKNIALVSQDNFLFADSVEYNIQCGDLSKNSPEEIIQSAKLAMADEFIQAKGLSYKTNVGEAGSQFSGGEKQRLSIARAIFKDSSILVLDEATSALDSVSEKQVQKGLASLMAGKTSFVIAHRLSTVQMADKILVMKDGIIEESGTHEELMNLKGEYYKLIHIQ